MSLFVAGQAFPSKGDFAAAKIGVFCAPILVVLFGGCSVVARGAFAGNK